MAERRHYPRYPAAWAVRLWPTEDLFLFGRAADVSLHGLRLVLSKLSPTATVSPGESYRIDVSPWPWPHAELRCNAVIRHVSGDGIGVETRGGLPVGGLSGPGEPPRGRRRTNPDSSRSS